VLLTVQTRSTDIRYEWTRNNAPLANNTASIWAKEEGIYSVSAVGTNGCRSLRVSKQIEVHDMPYPPNILVGIAVCAGNGTSLQVEMPRQNEVYRWCRADSNEIIGAISESYTVYDTKNYVVQAGITYSNDLTCIAYSAPRKGTIYPTPMAPIVVNRLGTSDSSCTGAIIEFEARRSPADTAATIN
jgi:hypothetical protein